MSDPRIDDLNQIFAGQEVLITRAGLDLVTARGVCKQVATVPNEPEYVDFVLYGGRKFGLLLDQQEADAVEGMVTPETYRRRVEVVGPRRGLVVIRGDEVVAMPVIEVARKMLNNPNWAGARLRGQKEFESGESMDHAIQMLLQTLKAAGFSGEWDDYVITMLSPEVCF